jgi:putative hydrolase of the HAD superfamily
LTVRAVVFDIGGVLEITPALGTLTNWESRLGLPPGELMASTTHVWTAGAVGTSTLDQVHAGLCDALDITPAVVEALMADIWTEYLGTLNDELTDYFRSLRPRYRTGILSNSFVGAREKEQEAYGFPEMTDTIVYSHEVGMAKPDRRIYELTCERLDVRPEEMVFLDDSRMCVDGALEVGIQAIRYEDTAQAIADIEARLAA